MIAADDLRLSASQQRSAIAFYLTAILAVGACEQLTAAAPTLTHVFPPGGRRGSTVTVACKGKFDWPVSVAAGGVSVAVGKDSGKLEITIPADLPADRVWIRLYNAEGASAAVPFLIGSLKELEEVEPNDEPDKAQKLEAAAVTINGVLKKAEVDGFAVALEAGQTLVAALDANTKLGSPVDAILQVATEDGFVLAENHDELGLDPRLVYRAEKEGVHIVRVFAFPATPNSTIAFFGDDNSIYRLTVTTGPFIVSAAPMSASLSQPQAVEPLGWNLPPGMTLPVMPLGGAESDRLLELEPLAEERISPDTRPGLVYSPEAGGSARVRLAPSPVLVGVDSADQPQPLPVPGAVTGRLSEPRESDRYVLKLQKGQPLLVIAEGRTEFPADPVLQLLDPKGTVVATIDDPSPKKNPVLNHKAAQDGDYELRIRDRYRRGSDWSWYQLTTRLEEPDFELTLSADAVTAAPDKPGELTVNVQRRGSGVGPITIEAVDLPEGVTAAAVISESKGDSSKKVKLSINSAGPAFSGPIRIVGTSKEPAELKRFARTPTQLGASFDAVWLTAIAKP